MRGFVVGVDLDQSTGGGSHRNAVRIRFSRLQPNCDGADEGFSKLCALDLEPLNRLRIFPLQPFEEISPLNVAERHKPVRVLCSGDAEESRQVDLGRRRKRYVTAFASDQVNAEIKVDRLIAQDVLELLANAGHFILAVEREDHHKAAIEEDPLHE